MTRSEKAVFLVYLMGLVAAIATVTLLKGALYIDRHEGDTLHLAEIILRMAQGQWPHIDFVTPLGIMAFAPISFFVAQGHGVGQSILLGQIAFAAAVIPAIWWVAGTRFHSWLAYAYGTGLIIMSLAMIHGQADPHISMSMHYNRWGWVVAFLAIPLAVLGPRARPAQVVDGVIVGLAISFLILCKATYAVAFAPVLMVALIARQQMRALTTGAICVGICMIAITIVAGTGFWPAYIGDLLQVSSSDIRPRAGLGWTDLVLAPAYLLGNAMVLCAVYLLRKGENPTLGLLLVLLMPGFVYVTYQNYGNDPKWLALLAVLLLAGQPSRALSAIALVSASLIAPSFLNMAISPLRHLKLPVSGFTSTFDEAPHDDFFTMSGRVFTVNTQARMRFESAEFASLNDLAEFDEPPVWRGAQLPTCLQQTGLIGAMRAIAQDLDAQGLGEGKTIFTADTFGGFWMFGASAPLIGGAPWYYGGLSGYEAADYLLVPTCPSSPRAFRAILKELAPVEDGMRQIRATELYTLYEVPKTP